jgi:LmbE family N-acetylglucosaminyl deacetylase
MDIMDKLIKEIVKKKTPVYFISPHLDDAVFSAGGLMSLLSTKTKVSVINVFTEGGQKKPTLSARMYLWQSRILDPKKLFELRKLEDSYALSTLKITPLNLGIIDSLWRVKNDIFQGLIPELNAVYPTYQLHIAKGKPAKEDQPLMMELLKTLQKQIPSKAIVFAPLAVGNHVDHVIVRDTSAKLKNKVIYWSDYPYNQTKKPNQVFIQNKKLKKMDLDINLNTKKKLMSFYVTQFLTAFPKGIKKIPKERYFI